MVTTKFNTHVENGSWVVYEGGLSGILAVFNLEEHITWLQGIGNNPAGGKCQKIRVDF